MQRSAHSHEAKRSGGFARLPAVESRIFGNGRRRRDQSVPAAMPRMMGLVTIPFKCASERYHLFSLTWFKDRENYNSHYIVKRDAGNDHQWCHTCISVKVLDNGDTKDRCAAAVGCLDKLAPDIGRVEKTGQEHGDHNTERCDRKTEKEPS